jgi:hypothetical protein
MKTSIPIGGLVAAGFDASGAYLLIVTHSGRGVFSTETWERVARDYEVIYPDDGKCPGIGPIDREIISVSEMDFEKGVMRLKSPDRRISLECESGAINVEVH